MILTFEVSEDRESLNIFFDEEGRDQLIQRLSDCTEPGDHYHLMPEGASVPGFAVTTKRFLRDTKAVPWVDVGLLITGRTPIEDEGDSDG
jgi:hypothetical protein